MYIFKFLLVSGIFLNSAFASDDMLQKMHKMEIGLNKIQKGFLYNQIATIKDGVKDIQEANKVFHNQKETEKYLPKNKMHLSNIAFYSAKSMDMALESLMLYTEQNQMSKSHQAYSKIILSCGSCHSVVRGW